MRQRSSRLLGGDGACRRRRRRPDGRGRNAPALEIIDRLLESGASVRVYDPVAGPGVKKMYGDRIDVVANPYAALENVDGLVISTEWREFHNPDFKRMGEVMREKAIFDGRNLFEPKLMQERGFRYMSIGRPSV